MRARKRGSLAQRLLDEARVTRKMDEMDSSNSSTLADRPWFRQPFVWLVIGIPLSSVIVGMVMLWLSIVSFDGMVADDYYKKGLEINRVLDRERAAVTAQLSGMLVLRDNDSRLQLTSALAGYRLPDQVQVKLSYATSAGQDVAFSMTRLAGSAQDYSGPALNLPTGRWYVYVSMDYRVGHGVGHGDGDDAATDGWRLSGVLSTPGDGVVSVSPNG